MKLKPIYCAGVLAASLAVTSGGYRAVAQDNAAPSQQSTAGTDAANIPLDRLVTATCRQAWQMGGRTQEGFFAIVKRLAELSAQNRGITLPDNKAAGARAGQWIHTQALKDPDQLLYAVVDHAVRYNNTGRQTNATANGQSKPAASQQ